MNCRICGVPQPNITWYKDGNLLVPRPTTIITTTTINGTTTEGLLMLSSVNRSDTGNYTCSGSQVLQSRGGEELVTNSTGAASLIVLCESITIFIIVEHTQIFLSYLRVYNTCVGTHSYSWHCILCVVVDL